MNDEQLMLEVHAGSREAFEALFERLLGLPVWWFLRRRRRLPSAGLEAGG